VGSKVKIIIPGDGNCLFNSILVGYLAARKTLPVLYGAVVRSQQDLRDCLKKYYDDTLANDPEFMASTKQMLVDLMEAGSFPGIPKGLPLRKNLEELAPLVRSDEDNLALIPEELIKDYIDAMQNDGVWGGHNEIAALQELLGIRFCGFGMALELAPVGEVDLIDISYEGGNHFNIYVNQQEAILSEVQNFLRGINGSASNPSTVPNLLILKSMMIFPC
jgi:hypothetical protein